MKDEIKHRVVIHTDAAVNSGIVGYGFIATTIDPVIAPVAITDGLPRVLHIGQGALKGNYPSGMNVAGELHAVRQALKWSVKYAEKIVNSALFKRSVNIVSDYSGCQCFATGMWEANTDIAKKYMQDVTKLRGRLNFLGWRVLFTHVKGHEGFLLNEFADRVAKLAAITAKEKRAK